MKIIAISDTHNTHHGITLPEGDTLVHSGDFSMRGTENECRDFGRWFSSLPYKNKILVYGNHDFLGETDSKLAESLIKLNDSVHILNEQKIEIDGKTFYGAPHTPWFHDWAFNRSEDELKEIWAKIPEGLDLLITHGPPHMIRDMVPIRGTLASENVGDKWLKKNIDRALPKWHVFGHIHEEYGWSKINGVNHVNASIMNERYVPVNRPIIFDI